MRRLAVPELRPLAAAALRAFAPEFGLDPERLKLTYRRNPGGFVNASFTVTDGRSRRHLKLGDEPGYHRAFRRTLELGARLSERYHAPRVLGWLSVPQTPWAGLVFEHVDGTVPRLDREPRLLGAVVETIGALHRDRELAAALPRPAAERSCFDAFAGNHLERFREDLRHVRQQPPAFLSAATLDWLAAEATALERRARASPAFRAPAATPCHNDIWSENLLRAGDGGWYLLDWDELAPGDPALDYTLALSPPPERWRRGAWREWPTPATDDPAFAERMELLERANLLDWVIDPLADWIEAAADPDMLRESRASKQRTHRTARARYEATYGAAGRGGPRRCG